MICFCSSIDNDLDIKVVQYGFYYFNINKTIHSYNPFTVRLLVANINALSK